VTPEAIILRLRRVASAIVFRRSRSTLHCCARWNALSLTRCEKCSLPP